MIKTPVNLLWNIIGDFFTRSIDDDDKRPVEALWQSMSDLSGDMLSYIDGYKRLKSVFLASPFADWGTVPADLSDVDPEEDSIIIGVDGRIITVYSDNEVNQFGGFIRIDDKDFEYLSANYSGLQSGGGTATMALREEVSLPDNPSSSDFTTSRWENQGTVDIENGNLDVPGLQWGILADTLHIDGAQTWEQLWKISVNEWSQGLSRRSVAINSFGDSGPGFEVRVQHKNGRTEILSGSKAISTSISVSFSSNTITRTTGNFISDGFQAGDMLSVFGSSVNNGDYEITNVTGSTITVNDTFISESPSNITLMKHLNLMGHMIEAPEEIEFIVRYNRGRMRASAWVNGELFAQSDSFRVPPGRRTHTLDAFNENHSLNITPKFMLLKSGMIWDNQATPLGSIISNNFTHIYDTGLPLVDSGLVQSEPWNFGVDAEVTRVGNEVHVIGDEDWLGYTPEYAWIGDALCELISKDTYRIISDGELKDRIETFSTEVQWLGDSIIASPYPLPDKVFIVSSKAREYNLHERFGRLMRLPKREDSQTYLNSIRGMQASLLSSPTEDNIKRGLSILLGSPYAEEAGFLSEVGDDYFILNGKRYPVNRFLTPFMSKRRRTVEHLEPLVDEVEIYDFIINHEEVKKVTNIWNSWSTFAVKISDTLSTRRETVEDVIRLLRSVKDKRYDFVIEFFTKREDGEPLSDFHDEGYSPGNAGTYEDMVFDDGGAVVNNASNQEKQEDGIADQGWLDEGLALSSDLVRFKPKILDIFGKRVIRRNGVHINRDLSTDEEEKGFTMKTLRFGDSGGVKPTEIHRVLDTSGILVKPAPIMDPDTFTTEWQTTSNNESITLPLVFSGTYNFVVDWGDGTDDTITSHDDAARIHTYAEAGTYTVSITGICDHWNFWSVSDSKNKIIDVKNWGILRMGSAAPNAFRSCINLNVTALDAPDMTGITSLSGMFHSCESLVGAVGFGTWDTSLVTDMGWMFNYANSFNQNIGSWDTSLVTDMGGMFRDADAFNQDISLWNVSNVEDMSYMFQSANSFNQEIGGWNTSSVTTMEWMFNYADAFNQDIGGWNISGVTNMNNMFLGTALSTPNYDGLLIGWAAQVVQPDINFNGGSSKYSTGDASDARDTLTSAPNNWTITDGGQA